MSLSVIDEMISAGCSLEQIKAAVDNMKAKEEAKAIARREAGARRQRQYMARKKADENDTADASASSYDVTDCHIASDSVSGVSPYKETARADALIPVGSCNQEPILETPDLKIGPPKSKSEKRSSIECQFERFWDCYPKKTNKKAAHAKFLTAVRNHVSAEKIITACQRFAEATRRAMTEKQFIPAPDVWLNKGRYDDEDLPQQARAGPTANHFEKRNPVFQAYEELMAEENGRAIYQPDEQFSESHEGKIIDLVASGRLEAG